MATTNINLGFIGLGHMGGGMTRVLLKAGFKPTVFDLDGGRIAAAVDEGATSADSAADLVTSSDVVMTSLPSSDVFVHVAENDLLPNARAGQVFVDLGTTRATETRRLAALFAEKGASLLDTPVSGYGGSGEMYIFAGGNKAAFDCVFPVLDALSREGHPVYCGESGSGQIVKGVNQLAMGLGAAAYLEAVAYGVRAGVDPDAIGRAVGDTTGWRATVRRVAEGASDGRSKATYVKFPELHYFLDEAEEKGLTLPLTEAMYEFLNVAPIVQEDNMGRPIPSFWEQLLTRAKGS